MKRFGASPSTGSASRGSRGDTQQQGNTMDEKGVHQSNNLGAYQIYSGGGDRKAKRQARSGKYRQDQAFRGLQEKISAFEKGSGDSLKKLTPTNAELTEVVNKEYKSTKKGSMADEFPRKAVQILSVQHRHERTIAMRMKNWMDGGHGYVPDKKPGRPSNNIRKSE